MNANRTLKKWIPLFVLFLLAVLAYKTGYLKYLSFESLQEHRRDIVELVLLHQFLAPLLFFIINVLSIVLFLPIGVFLAIVGGFLFHLPLGPIYSALGTTFGAAIVYLVTSTAIGENYFLQKAGPTLKKMENGFKKNAASYLLFMRLIPFSPFWVVTLSAAFFGVPFWIFIWTTFVGIIPSLFIFAQFGSTLGTILDAGRDISMREVLSWENLCALGGLALISLFPLVIKKIFSKKRH